MNAQSLLVLDLEKCTRCDECTRACSDSHNGVTRLIREGLRFFYPRMSPRGSLLIHDYNAWPGARRAVDEFFADKGELPVPMPDKSGSALVIKQ